MEKTQKIQKKPLQCGFKKEFPLFVDYVWPSGRPLGGARRPKNLQL